MAAGELRLICARMIDPDVHHHAEDLPMVRRCHRCGQKVVASRTSLEMIAKQGAFVIICLNCHKGDPGAKVIFNSHGQYLGHVPARDKSGA